MDNKRKRNGNDDFTGDSHLKSRSLHKDEDSIICNDPPCNGIAVSAKYYPSHVEMYHDQTCIECGKNLVKESLLNLHQEEVHNPLFYGRRLRCFESDCLQEFESHAQRRKHLIEFHHYPCDDDKLDMIYTGYSLSLT
ncbi:HBL149Cp [Eremothecium sinecaudum]|uniref:HBL149Cp n=1 Tax=Eremothecium sinecaudum TaxID=45286 RepID=A0A109UWA7_9SACH|nr:HBL149Cp [Eremothecium sinecaudum]AMD18753.1 HBL149Cp [Eremothecium sinecaudum]